MATFTTTGKYVRGIIKPARKPQFKNPDEVLITFIKNRKPVESEDLDEQIFKAIEPQYRKIRRQVFKEQFPKLYEKYYRKEAQSGS